MGVSDESQATVIVPLGKTSWYPMDGRPGPRAGLDVVPKRKISVPAGIRTLVIQPVASHYTE